MNQLIQTTLQEAKKVVSRTDWARLDRMTDADIAQAIQEDSDSACELTEDWFKSAQLVYGEEAVAPYAIAV